MLKNCEKLHNKFFKNIVKKIVKIVKNFVKTLL